MTRSMSQKTSRTGENDLQAQEEALHVRSREQVRISGKLLAASRTNLSQERLPPQLTDLPSTFRHHIASSTSPKTPSTTNLHYLSIKQKTNQPKWYEALFCARSRSMTMEIVPPEATKHTSIATVDNTPDYQESHTDSTLIGSRS